MSRIRSFWILAFAGLFSILALSSPLRAAGFNPSRFEYDRGLPLAVELKVYKEIPFPAMTYYHITYLSANGQRVPGLFMTLKKAKAPTPCVVFVHGFMSSKDSAEMVFPYLAKRGWCGIAIDAPLHGERKALGANLLGPWLEEDVKSITQFIIDLRRAVDFLDSRPEVDHDRLALIASSMGSVLSPIFLGIEPRIKAAALMVGGADWKMIMEKSTMFPASVIRYEKPRLERLAELFSEVDGVNYIGRFAPRPLLMLNGRIDTIIPNEATRALFDAAGEPKEIVWYDSGHNIPILKAMDRIMKWMQAKIDSMPKPAATIADQEPKPAAFDVKFSVPKGKIGEQLVITLTPGPDAESLSPQGKIEEFDYIFPLFDNGLEQDAKAGDGVWTVDFPLNEAFMLKSTFHFTFRLLDGNGMERGSKTVELSME